MDFSKIIGQEHIKAHLKTTLEHNRVAHAQLFVGNSGSGLLPLALAYSSALLCQAHQPDSESFLRCARSVNNLAHPDLHFVYPVSTNSEVKKNAVSDSFSDSWRSFVSANSYGSLFHWFQHLGIENKQGIISVRCLLYTSPSPRDA